MHKFEKIRQQLNITKTEMAKRLGVSKSNYSMIIHGQHGISKRVALKAHKEFGISLEELFFAQVHPDETDTGTEGPQS
ncbi:MAG: helix-turn-helix transcriptional regulator [Sphaerochaetaceae bacterium]|nr:helix-turn-helix transcriptional regulator [Sphaerochaetaceae bacterium]